MSGKELPNRDPLERLADEIENRTAPRPDEFTVITLSGVRAQIQKSGGRFVRGTSATHEEGVGLKVSQMLRSRDNKSS